MGTARTRLFALAGAATDDALFSIRDPALAGRAAMAIRPTAVRGRRAVGTTALVAGRFAKEPPAKQKVAANHVHRDQTS